MTPLLSGVLEDIELAFKLMILGLLLGQYSLSLEANKNVGELCCFRLMDFI